MKVLDTVELHYNFTKALENSSNSRTGNMCDSEAICNFSSKVARSYLPEAYMHAQGGVKHPSSKPTMSLSQNLEPMINSAALSCTLSRNSNWMFSEILPDQGS
jgi:hypothetical protein